MKKPTEAQILKETSRFRSMPSNAPEDSIDERLRSIRKLLADRARSSEDLVKIVERCIRSMNFMPSCAEVNETIATIRSEEQPFWKTPVVEPRTRQDVLDDIEFQKQFAIDRPKLAIQAQDRIVELQQELLTFEVPA